MINTILIDDEKNALEVLEMQLSRYCKEVTILASCDGGAKGIAAIKKYNPDLVFLDIEMPHKNGFDVLNETKGNSYNVIFTTAYDQFAIKAFRVSAIDYLLKPVDITELQAAVEKVKQKKSSGKFEDNIKVLLNHLQGGQQKMTDKIALPVGDAMQFFSPNDIIRCESESNYTHIFLADSKKITMAKTLKDVEENINGSPFFRVHQSHLINMNHISKYIKGDNAYVIMSDGSQIGISRNRKDAFLDTFRKA